MSCSRCSWREADELVQRAVADLLALEAAPRDAGLIDSAFRAVHTLKGGVALFDLAPMGALLHAAEDLLGACRGQARRRPPGAGGADRRDRPGGTLGGAFPVGEERGAAGRRGRRRVHAHRAAARRRRPRRRRATAHAGPRCAIPQAGPRRSTNHAGPRRSTNHAGPRRSTNHAGPRRCLGGGARPCARPGGGRGVGRRALHTGYRGLFPRRGSAGGGGRGTDAARLPGDGAGTGSRRRL